MPTSMRPRWAPVVLIFFVTLALAALQNITVDDAVLVGSVVPEYLPSSTDWNQGNNCSICLVHPNASLARNGTWHDQTYNPVNGFAPSFTFSFSGSALYIYFILGNTVPGSQTLTNVSFLLDGKYASTFTHIPTTSTAFEYNVAVYANDALTFGQHNMIVQPADTGSNSNGTLMLFDYLVYTTETNNASATGVASSAPPSNTSPGQTSPTSSSTNIAPIVGGVVAGVVVLGVLLVGSFLWYRRHKRCHHGFSQPIDETIEALPHHYDPPLIAPVPYRDIPSPAPDSFQVPVPAQVPPVLVPATRANITISENGSLVLAPPPVWSPISESSGTFSSTSGSEDPSGSTSEVHGLMEQVGLLRDELAQLREQRNEERNVYAMESLPPPEYSEGSRADDHREEPHGLEKR